jgi:superfamily II DNA/RNA helicase
MRRLFGIRCMALFGGQDKESQLLELEKQHYQIIVATPGRLLDVVASKKIKLSLVTYLVIDEADKMLSLGFFDQLNAIFKQVRPDRQTLLLSATFPQVITYK